MSTLTIAAGGTVRMPVRRAETRQRPAPLHLTRRGRLLVLLLALVAVCAVTFAASGAVASGPQSAPEVERYLVAPGDTLWDIAAGLTAPGEDVRDVVRELVLLNHLPSAGLTSGQEIVLPVDR